MSIAALLLGDISWPVSDVHLLMACLSIKQITTVRIMEDCNIRFCPMSSNPTSLINVGDVLIQTPIRINTLVSLLSQLDVHTLMFGQVETLDDILRDTHLTYGGSDLHIIHLP